MRNWKLNWAAGVLGLIVGTFLSATLHAGTAGSRPVTADQYLSQGRVADGKAATAAAIQAYEKAISLYESSSGTEAKQVECHVRIGKALSGAGRHEEAVASFKRGLEVGQNLTGTAAKSQREDCYRAFGLALKKLGRYEEAVASYANSLKLLGEIPRTEPLQAAVYQEIAALLYKLDQHQAMLQNLEKALLLLQKLPNAEAEEARCRLNMAIAMIGLGQDDAALVAASKALVIYEAIGDTPKQQAACHLRIGTALKEMGRLEEAIASEEKALSLFNKVADTERDQAGCQHNLGTALHNLGHYEAALAAYAKAMSMFQKLPAAEQNQADLHINIGNCARDMGRFDAAMESYKAALQLFEKLPRSERKRALCIGNIAEALRAMGRFDEAVLKYRQAREGGGGIWLQTGYALALEAQGKPADLALAAKELLDAASRGEQYRQSQYSLDARISASAYISAGYSHLSRFLVNRAAAHWELRDTELKEWAQSGDAGQQCLAAAFHFADAGKARALLEGMQQREITVGQDSSGQALLAQDGQLLLQIGSLHQKKIEAKGMGAAAAENEIDAKIRELERKRQQIDYELRSTYTGRFTSPTFKRVAEIQQSLPQSLAILQCVVTEEESKVIVLTRQCIAGYAIPVRLAAPWDAQTTEALVARFATDGPKIGLEGLVRLYRAPLDASDPQGLAETMLKVGLELSDLLLPAQARQLLAEQKISHLVVIPEGPLHALPFAALPLAGAGAAKPGSLAECRFLVEDYAVSYLPSWKMLGSIRWAAAEREKVPGGIKQKELLALADPVFGKNDPRAGQATTTAPAEDLGVVLRGYYEKYGWKRLPETQEEALKVAGVFARDRVARVSRLDADPTADAQASVYLGTAATPNALLRAQQYRRILFATHGLADPANAWLSCVVLSGSADAGYAQPGYLKAADVMQLKLDADLVTVSGCETALGRLSRGEGMVGLSSAFFMAGAKSLALTLWKVPSGETGGICIAFHESLKTEKNKALALRQAQLQFLKEHPQKRHPFWWGAFVVTGDWE